VQQTVAIRIERLLSHIPLQRTTFEPFVAKYAENVAYKTAIRLAGRSVEQNTPKSPQIGITEQGTQHHRQPQEKAKGFQVLPLCPQSAPKIHAQAEHLHGLQGIALCGLRERSQPSTRKIPV
jgi:hypothetical protein